VIILRCLLKPLGLAAVLLGPPVRPVPAAISPVKLGDHMDLRHPYRGRRVRAAGWLPDAPINSSSGTIRIAKNPIAWMPWHQALLEWSFLPSEMPVKGFVASRISLEVGKQTRRAIIQPRIYSLVLSSEAVGKCRCSMLRRCLRREITGCRFHLLPRLYGRVAGGERFSTFLHEIVIAARRIPTRLRVCSS
jgi:hypothetical protein